MTGELIGWLCLASFVAGVALCVRGMRRRRRVGGTCCPGPRGSVWRVLDFRFWVVQRGCWYDLTGLPERGDGGRRCPECGTVSLPSERLRAGQRLRALAVGQMLILAACAALAGAALYMPWPRVIPTIFLVEARRGAWPWRNRVFEREIYARVTNGQADFVSVRALIPQLMRDLADDKRPHNATRAGEMLEAVWPTSRAALEGALRDSDWQRRTIATNIVRANTPAGASDALLEACVDDLADDDDGAPFFTTSNAREGAEYLLQYPERLDRLLPRALRSEDRQQRLMAAAVAGFARRTALLPQAAPILLDELCDDAFEGNAKLAAPALYRFGPAAIAYLVEGLDTRDEQGRSIVLALIDRLLCPACGVDDVEHALPRLTTLVHDPLTELEFGECATDCLRSMWP